ncbi:Gfo/Idh/MocA family protein [Auraticoccus monumenti]|uniref:Predicted dehydrogenase n=1 Tax=Auraticoccus monumenti TaxID=675864 RepID=A0A1G6VYA0_9ACTN|nr:Gfo/Idh/MocA family oxidoreductase [Auraticoccus monumenti]SDD57957.1 Predicted dehydrogenase [Auraticoccus monumenti]
MSRAHRPLRVAMIGYAFMGAAHSQAWRNVHRFFDLELTPEMAVLVGRDAEAVAAAATTLGWAETSTDWREVVARDDIDVVDICTPGDTHAEIALAALAAGKHVLCEKPLANTVAEAEEMVAAAERARAEGVRSMVGFSYRRVPAVALMRQMVAEGAVGEIRHIRGLYLQDWIVDPEFPLVWRLQKDKAGSGALGDIGAHILDMAQFVTGQRLSSLTARTETFVKERPLVEQAGGSGGKLGASAAGARTGPVTVDDAAVVLARTDGGALATFEATRFATGRRNRISLEVNGSAGSLAFDFEQMNELQHYDHSLGDRAGFSTISVTEPTHPYLEAWWPPGHGLGYEHTFVNQARDFLVALAAGEDPSPSFADGAQIQQLLAAVETSSAEGSWQQL